MTDFGLFLFSTAAEQVRAAEAGGVSAVVVDWERTGKRERQRGADTQIGSDTLDDLRRVRAATRLPVICRINATAVRPPGEIEAAIAAGADELLVPMVRNLDDVRHVIEEAAGRAAVGVLVETMDAIRIAAQLDRLPLSRVYVGLNDLCIDRRSPSIFSPLADGLLEHIRSQFSKAFGFAGLTLPDAGDPVPCRLLLGEMARLQCDFSFLRRSFQRDAADWPLDRAVGRIREGLAGAAARPAAAILEDRAQLVGVVRALDGQGSRVAS